MKHSILGSATVRLAWAALLMAGVSGALLGAEASPAKLKMGLVVGEAAADKPGAEARAAHALAGRLHEVALISPAARGKFLGAGAEEVTLDRFAVVWIHQGDAPSPPALLIAPETIAALRQYVADGHGLLVSGAALALVRDLGVERLHVRVGGPGNDRSAAGVTPLVPTHPIFRGLALAGSSAVVTDAGFPAFADFHGSGGPSGGMLLASAWPDSGENPLAEYELGKGRLIAMGWRLPHFSNAANTHRANLERLTANILAYLADGKQWQKVVTKPVRRGGPAKAAPGVPEAEWQAAERAVNDLVATFGPKYPNGAEYLKRLGALKKTHDGLLGAEATSAARLNEIAEEFQKLRAEALLANPLLDFDRLLLVKRRLDRLGLPANWDSNSSLPRDGYDNEIVVLSDFRGQGTLTTLLKPEGGRFAGDVDLHWNADRMLFSMPGKNGRWQIHEVKADGTGLRELPLIVEPDVDNYDACYLPNGRILFTSTAPFVGVPCVTGSSHVSNLYLYDPAKGTIRRLTFEQDHDWCPTVLPNGRVLYLRWEYADIPHYVARILFHMNPDGTEQMEYYGSNSYWPNSTFYARPCPGHPTRFVGVVSGHHDVARLGELVLFDAAVGRREADGVIQRIPGWGRKVEPVIRDGLVGGAPPKFLHPWPLSDKYFLVSSNAAGGPPWDLCLVDVFDNRVPIKSVPGYALLEPIPLKGRPVPPVIPDKIDPDCKDALVFMSDVYAGPGLKGVPRGTVKRLRLVTYQFAYHGMGGQVNRVGLDGPWDVKRIIGTVPVEPDGSAYFRVPANTPIALQPLDAEGRALQLMRSWMTAMPGEVLSCVGCHEPHSTGPSGNKATATHRAPSPITPWYGPPRGFAFKREVQPVLDAYCVRCHDGRPRDGGQVLPDFTVRAEVHPKATDEGYNRGTKFSPSYIALRSYVRGHTIESDMHLLEPCEFHAATTELVQRLKKGHPGVALDGEAWERLYTWIDLNTPYHGTWREIVGDAKVHDQRQRRLAMDRLYAGRDDDPEADADLPAAVVRAATSSVSDTPTQSGGHPARAGWPFDAAEAKRRQAAGGPVARGVELGGGITLELVRVPEGEFVMGDAGGWADEKPLAPVRIGKPFWMGKFEVTNEQFAAFDPAHDSRLEVGDFLQFSVQERGYPVNGPKQPVCRISWEEAMAFCRWLSDKTGERFTLPTEAQWEYACRAGTATALWYGGEDADFAPFANLADRNLRAVDTFGWNLPSGAVPPWRPAVESVNDGHRVSAPVGTYRPNAWGLYDMHGNVWEWTRTTYRPYPYASDDGRDSADGAASKVVRGGSWYDRPKRCRSAFRLDYPAWQGVYNVGVRVICEDGASRVAARGSPPAVPPPRRFDSAE